MKIRSAALRCFFAAIIAVVTALRTEPTAAEIAEDCASAHSDPWSRLAACAEIIDSQQWASKRLGWAFSNRAVAQAALGNGLAAFEDHNRAIELDPSNAKAWNNRATSHAAFREYNQALSDYSQAIKLDPGYVNALVNRASVYFETDRADEAKADYDQAIALAIAQRKAHDDLLFLRADAACRLGLIDRSIADRQPALRNGVYPREELARLLRQAGYAAEGEGIDLALRAWTKAGCP